MSSEPFPPERVFTEITTEAEARALLWRSRFQGQDFDCLQCHSEEFYALRTRPEVRTCKGCRRQLRLRAGTICESSKTALLLWVKALFSVMQGKRGLSPQERQRHLSLESSGGVRSMLQNIRAALQHRDAGYQVGDGVIELDAGTFGRREPRNQCDILVAIETKAWVDAQDRERSRAGFAKMLVGKETKGQAQQLVDTGVRAGAMVNTDGSWSFRNVVGVDVDYQTIKWYRAIPKRVTDGCPGSTNFLPTRRPGSMGRIMG